MSNPGPATTVTAHPSNLSTNQALRLIGVAKGVNLSATGFTPIPVNNTTTYLPKELIVTNVNNAGANVTLTTTTAMGISTVNAGSPSSLFGAIAPTALSTTLGVSYVDSSATTAAIQNQTLYANVTVASSTTATGDVYVYGYDLTSS